MQYKVFNLKVNRQAVDVISAMLYDYPIQGVEILDESLTDEEKAAMFVDVMDMDNTVNEEVTLRFYLSEEENVGQLFADIQAGLKESAGRINVGSLRLSTDESDDNDWAYNWKTFYKPFMIGDRILIRPIWEKVDSINGVIPEIIVDIDPGMAFGSGTHETTSVCVRALDKYIKGDERLIDVGCGSGILGIVSAKLGIREGILIDLDQSACKIAVENVETNGVADKLRVIHGNLVDKVTEKADVVVANIFAEVIIGVTPEVKDIVKADGLFIASGIIREKEIEVAKALEDNGFEIIETLYDGGWVGIVSRRRHL